MLPFVIYIFMIADLACTVIAAVAGPEHAALALSPVGHLAVVGTGAVVHEVCKVLTRARRAVRRWWQRRR